MTMFDLLAMEPAKAAPIPERNQIDAPPRGIGFLPPERVRGAGRQAEAAVDAVCDLIFQRRVVWASNTLDTGVTGVMRGCASSRFHPYFADRDPHLLG